MLNKYYCAFVTQAASHAMLQTGWKATSKTKMLEGLISSKVTLAWIVASLTMSSRDHHSVCVLSVF